MRHKFKEQEKEAVQVYEANQHAVIRRQRKKRITRQVRLSELNCRRLKIHAAEEGVTMSRLLDKLVGQFFKKK